MPNYRRSFTPGGTYFFTVTLANRGTTLLVDEIDLLRKAYVDTTRRLPFITIAICVLPDHLHTVWHLPAHDADYPGRWRSIKAGFSRGVTTLSASRPSIENKRERGIWQRRYWEHRIRDERDLRNHVDYIHFNPVKHGLVDQVCDWPYSSFHRFVERGDLPKDWAGTRAVQTHGLFGE